MAAPTYLVLLLAAAACLGAHASKANCKSPVGPGQCYGIGEYSVGTPVQDTKCPQLPLVTVGANGTKTTTGVLRRIGANSTVGPDTFADYTATWNRETVTGVGENGYWTEYSTVKDTDLYGWVDGLISDDVPVKGSLEVGLEVLCRDPKVTAPASWMSHQCDDAANGCWMQGTIVGPSVDGQWVCKLRADGAAAGGHKMIPFTAPENIRPLCFAKAQDHLLAQDFLAPPAGRSLRRRAFGENQCGHGLTMVEIAEWAEYISSEVGMGVSACCHSEYCCQLVLQISGYHNWGGRRAAALAPGPGGGVCDCRDDACPICCPYCEVAIPSAGYLCPGNAVLGQTVLHYDTTPDGQHAVLDHLYTTQRITGMFFTEKFLPPAVPPLHYEVDGKVVAPVWGPQPELPDFIIPHTPATGIGLTSFGEMVLCPYPAAATGKNTTYKSGTIFNTPMQTKDKTYHVYTGDNDALDPTKAIRCAAEDMLTPCWPTPL